jgi:hypothetical protein
MNQIAALLLLFMDEEDAFWALSAVVEKILPRDYYSKTMIGAQVSSSSTGLLLERRIVSCLSGLQTRCAHRWHTTMVGCRVC